MGRGGCTPPSARKIMVVADPTRESASALQYAISHAVLEHDELILIHVENLNTWKNTFTNLLRLYSSPSTPSPSMSSSSSSNDLGQGEVHFLEQMKRICELTQPNVRVRVECTGMETTKANSVLLLGDKLGVDVIIVGQRRTLSSAILGSKRYGGSQRGAKAVDTAEYLIENSKCTCVGVQKRGQNKGYLLNTKTQKNFWLLA